MRNGSSSRRLAVKHDGGPIGATGEGRRTRMSDTVIGVLGGSGVAAVITLLGSLLFRWLDHRTGRKSTLDKRLERIGVKRLPRSALRRVVKAKHIYDREDLDRRCYALGNGNLDA